MKAATASTTHTQPLGADVGVRFVIQVPSWAMCLAGIRGSYRVASQCVLAACQRFQVLRANTAPNEAQVVDFEATRDSANQGFISPAVSANAATRPISPAANPEPPVAVSFNEGSPQPTRPQFRALGRKWTILIDMAKEPLFDGKKALLERVGHLMAVYSTYPIRTRMA